MKHKKDSFIKLLEYYFNTYLPVAKGLSQATIKSYKDTFRLLMEFMYSIKSIPSDKIRFEVLDSNMIMEFLDWLETERKCSITTRNQRLSALAAFATYAQSRDFYSAAIFRSNIEKIPRKKVARQSRSSFTREEIKILFTLPNSNTEIGLRDKTLLCFMYASGMRAQEVCDLTVGDIQFYPERAGINVHGKGQKMRRIGIPKEAAMILKKYIEHRHIVNKVERHVFSSQTHEKMTVSCIEEIYAKYIIKAKSQYETLFKNKYTPHSMRHTTATHMIEAGVPLIVAKNFLGHVSLQTTQIYTEISQDTMNKQLKAWNDKWFLKSNLENDGNDKTSNIPKFLR